MRTLPFGPAFAVVMAASFFSPASAQSQTKSTAPTAPAQSKATPGTSGAAGAFDAHDLSGVWYEDQPRYITVMERYWVYKFSEDEPPMTAWGKAQFDAAKTSFGPRAVPLPQTNDPIYHTCTPPGFPRVLLHPFPMQIVQTPGEVIMLFEYDSIRHQIFTDGRKHDTSLGPLWMGDAIGHWEGDTLVAETVNFNDKTWLDRMGHPHSDQLRVVERIRRVDRDHLTDDLTFYDPKAYRKPWAGRLTFGLQPGWTLQEYFCEDQDTFEGIEADEIKPRK